MVQANDSPAIEARGLVKTYPNKVRALDGLELAVAKGSIHALLGPNGAGKSTTVKILTTLSRPDSGTASVLGRDVVREAEKVRRSIGVVGQNGAVDPEATGRENMLLQGSLYGMSGRTLSARADELLAAFGLTEPANRIVKTWSGGQKRKLDVATGLVHEPRVLFLDEPTTGLDPEARSELWAEVRRLNNEGLTILLTTHYLEEADQLAGQVAIIDRGKIVARGAPDELKSALRGDSIVLELGAANASALNGRLSGALASVDDLSEVVVDGRTVRARVGHGARAVPAVLAALDAAGIAVASVTVARPSLDDVYLKYTGRAYRPEPGGITMTALAETARMTTRHLRFFSRQPYFIGIFLVQPVIWLLLFGALFQNVINIPGFGWQGSYLDYLVPGVLVMTALFSCGWAGMSVIEDLDRSIMARFLVTPIHRSAIIAGLNLYEVVSLAIQALIIGGLALLLGAQFAGGFVGFAVLTLCAMLVGASVASVSDAMALTLRQRESVIGINTLLTLPLTFLSSAFMPLKLAPAWIATIAAYNPVNWAVEAGRQALTEGPDWSFVLPRLAGLTVLAIVTTAWATYTFKSYQRSI